MSENYLKKELYERVKRSSNIFEFIQRGSLDGIWYWDLKKPENEWMSPEFWKTLGYDPEEKQHYVKEWQDIIFKEDLEKIQVELEKHFADGDYPFNEVVRYRHKKGHIVWIQCRGIAVRDDEGVPIRMLGAHVDITHYKKAEEEIARISEEYEKVFNGTQDAMFLIEVTKDNGFRYLRTNEAHQIKTGISLETIKGKTPVELLGERQGEVVQKNYRTCIERQQSIQYEEVLALPGGEIVWLTTLTPILKEDGKSYIVGSAMDITDKKQLEKELERSANYDKLTQIPNRRLFFDRLNHLMATYERERKSFALLFVDLDGFKDINDKYGHKAGDDVLIEVADRLVECTRKSDTVARIGGDEFTVLLRNADEYSDIEKIAGKIQRSIEQPIDLETTSCNVGVSIGIARYPKDGVNADALLANADWSMYEIKKNGKGGYKFYSY
ncbi:MAG TPA: sensor domain-containing diguanylate cyclase [Eubacteriaceae bacterium]|nr:sensor domain-containing diguanylate cyclase [Eubacteriaceae bacterium]